MRCIFLSKPLQVKFKAHRVLFELSTPPLPHADIISKMRGAFIKISRSNFLTITIFFVQFVYMKVKNAGLKFHAKILNKLLLNISLTPRAIAKK